MGVSGEPRMLRMRKLLEDEDVRGEFAVMMLHTQCFDEMDRMDMEQAVRKIKFMEGRETVC